MTALLNYLRHYYCVDKQIPHSLYPHSLLVSMFTQGLDHCTLLEELYLDDNCIYKLEGLQHLSNLKKLSLSDNYLVQLDPHQLEGVSTDSLLPITPGNSIDFYIHRLVKSESL